MPSDMRFGELLRAIRVATGLTQEDLAARSGLSVRAIGELERNRTRKPYLRSARLLADALDLSDSVRARFLDAAALGYEPTGRRRTLFVNDDAVPTADDAAWSDRMAAGLVTPRHLPPAAQHFTGRKSELGKLAALARQAAEADSTVISVINGCTGVGKTALAVYWAHQAATRFPDGQLFVDLRGYRPPGTPMSSAEALRDLFDAFAWPAGQIPASLSAQVGLYRSLMASKRVLVVLDNAENEDQVRPLLAATQGCMTVITSRGKLAGLLATEHASLIQLNTLTEEEAHELLGRLLSPERVAREPGAAAQLIRISKRLPLAISVAAAEAAMRPDSSLTTVVAQLQASRAGSCAAWLRYERG